MTNSGNFEFDPIVYSEEVKRQMEEDPELAEAMREFSALMRQAMEDVKSGKYKSFEDAMEVLTGNKPVLISDIENGS